MVDGLALNLYFPEQEPMESRATCGTSRFSAQRRRAWPPPSASR